MSVTDRRRSPWPEENVLGFLYGHPSSYDFVKGAVVCMGWRRGNNNNNDDRWRYSKSGVVIYSRNTEYTTRTNA